MIASLIEAEISKKNDDGVLHELSFSVMVSESACPVTFLSAKRIEPGRAKNPFSSYRERPGSTLALSGFRENGFSMSSLEFLQKGCRKQEGPQKERQAALAGLDEMIRRAVRFRNESN